jgi:outer membrane protein W
MLSSSNNPLGTFTLHEIKGIERNIIPSFSTNYYFLNKNKIRVYSGIGLGAKITMPAQITYEFIELSNNSSYKYNQVSNKKISTEILMMGNIGGSLQVTSKLSFFAEAKMGISKRNTVKINSFLGTFLGVGYQF